MKKNIILSVILMTTCSYSMEDSAENNYELEKPKVTRRFHRPQIDTKPILKGVKDQTDEVIRKIREDKKALQNQIDEEASKFQDALSQAQEEVIDAENEMYQNWRESMETMSRMITEFKELYRRYGELTGENGEFKGLNEELRQQLATLEARHQRVLDQMNRYEETKKLPIFIGATAVTAQLRAANENLRAENERLREENQRLLFGPKPEEDSRGADDMATIDNALKQQEALEKEQMETALRTIKELYNKSTFGITKGEIETALKEKGLDLYFLNHPNF